MEITIHKAKVAEKSLKGHHYKNLIRLIHDEKRVIVGIVETSGHLDTNASPKNHIDMKLKKNLTPPVATPRRK
jgi:hypothetical protein